MEREREREREREGSVYFGNTAVNPVCPCSLPNVYFPFYLLCEVVACGFSPVPGLMWLYAVQSGSDLMFPCTLV